MSAQRTPEPPLAASVPTFTRIGLLSFGGPSAQIAVMHRILLEERRWFSEREFLDALGFCMLLPGPEAMQLATWAGWRRHGARGALVAGTLFVLPGALVMLALALLYARFGAVPAVRAAFMGVQASVLAIVLEAVTRLAKRALSDGRDRAIALATFLLVFACAVPFPLVILAAAAVGLVRGAPARANAPHAHAAAARPSVAASLRTLAFGLALWLAPLALLALRLGHAHPLVAIGAFFSRLALVTFGGAYAALSYMAQDVVARHGWLEPRQMLDGLGLAETTPGPLILVAEFVGTVAGWRAGGLPLALGGAAVSLWATFAPCFVWVLAGAPWLAHLGTLPRVRGALHAITAAVVGVIAQLAVWFAIHATFATVHAVRHAPWHFDAPVLASARPEVVALTLLAGVLLLRFKWPLVRVLLLTTALALALHALGLSH